MSKPINSVCCRWFVTPLLIALYVFGIAACGTDAPLESEPDEANSTQPAVELAEVYDLSGDDLHPEGGDYDPVTQSFYVGSLTQGNVVRLAADGSESIFFEGNGDDQRLTMGMRIDVERRRLWVCSMVIEEEIEPGLIWVFDLDDETKIHEFILADTFESASCNDVDIDPEGRGYITDRQNPHIYRIDLDDEIVEIWAEDELLEPEWIGLNGIVVTPDEEALIVTKFIPPTLIRISMDDPTDVREVTFEGDYFDGIGDSLISGADGLALRGEELYVAFSDTVMRLDFDDQWRHAHVSAIPIVSGLAAVILAEDHIYAVKGNIVEFGLQQEPDLPFQLLRIDLDIF